MKKIIKTLIVMLLFVTAGIINSCKEENNVPEVIYLNHSEYEMNAGETLQLKETVLPVNAEYKLEWVSDDEKIATVSDKGLVTAVAAGKAEVKAVAGNVSASCQITVKGTAGANDVIIDLSSYEKTLYIGDSFTVSATVTPVDREKDLVWRSEDDKIASVTSEGVVSALSAGTVKIIASIDDVEAVCAVTVKQHEGGLTITLDPVSFETEAGRKFQIIATVDPYDRKEDLVWTSSDKTIATVAEDGLVSTVSAGNVQIIAQIDDVKAICAVKVTPKPENVTFTINEEDDPIIIEEEGVHTLQYTIEPFERRGDLVWSSSDNSVVEVKSDRLFANKIGEAVITGKIDDIVKTVNVKVVAAPAVVTLDRTNATVQVGNTLQLNASVKPVSAQNKPITWSVDNEAIVSVSSTGLVKGLAKGVAIVKAQVDESVAECRVVVTETAGEIKAEWELYEIFDVEGYGKGMVVNVKRDWSDNHVKSITVMSMEFPMLQWAKDASVVVGNGEMHSASGMELTEKIAEKAKTYPGNFPAFEAVRALGENWYMPNDTELKDIYGYIQYRRPINEKLVEYGYSEMPESIWGAKEGRDTFTNYATFIDQDYWAPKMHLKTAVRGTMALMKLNLDEINQ